MFPENTNAAPDTTPAADTTTPAAAPDTAADALTAMDAGIAAAAESETAPPPAAKVETPAEPDPSVVQPADAPVPDGYVRDPQGRFAKKPEAAAPVPGTPEAKAAAEKGKAAADAAVEAEIAGLGLKDKAAARFRELTTEIKTLAPIKDLLDKAGVKDLAQLPAMLERSRKADDLIAMVMDTGATPDQYGMTLDYLKLVNRAAAGDRTAAATCLEMSKKEVAVFAKMLGQEIPGVHDPLAGHQDLLDEIEAGDLTRARALEIAQARELNSAVQQRTQQTQTQEQLQQATEQGKRQLAEFDAHMLANDPTYPHKRDILSGMVATIKETVHPSRWIEATQNAYKRIPANAAAITPPPPVPPPPVPPAPAGGNAMRPGGPRPAVLVPETATAEQAMDLGIAAAIQGG